MFIGEIKKPPVDGQLVKPKGQVSTAMPVTPSKSIGDQLDISIQAKERFVEYSNSKNKKKKKGNNSNQSVYSKHKEEQTHSHIDIIA
ncbi:MAG: hypothetical protein COB38_10195 [Gammaproteobacteria bacterium]|nr:MAG: hypothetical protein COB38_10195 [Gammaproteobacteria bacterium]